MSHVAVISGGVGGAKLLEGFYRLPDAPELVAIVNTGDDFSHLGLAISPDIDTALYTLAGLSTVVAGWGRADESWRFMSALADLGGPGWFSLGDRDLATHVLRTALLAQGHSLSAITRRFASAWGISACVLPMSDHPVRTMVDTDEGPLQFQQYFVERRCQPTVRAVRFDGASGAMPAPGVLEAIAGAEAVFIAPSNPFLSISPILAVAGIAEALRRTSAPIVAISPLIGGNAVKGPTAKIMDELGIARSNDALVDHYAGLIDGMLTDAGDPVPTSLPSAQCATLMTSEADKCRVAAHALEFAGMLMR